MPFRSTAVLLALGLCAGATDFATVNSVVAAVRASYHKKGKDADVAAALAKAKLNERLEDRVIEILESEGAGPQTLGALQHLRDVSRLLPPPGEPPPGMTPPPPPSAVEEHKVWQATRSHALDYTQSLPDFMCTETVHRWQDPGGNEEWQPSPAVAAELSFFDREEHYKLVTVDGKPSQKSLLEVGGTMSQGEFGSLLGAIFDPHSETDYRWDHWTTLRKRPTAVFFYRIAASHRPSSLLFGPEGGKQEKAYAGQRGYVYIDRETNRVTRIAEDAENIPADFPVQKSRAVLDYDYFDIGGESFLLPMRAEIRLDAGKLQSLNSVEFSNYRKFTSASNVNFGNSAPIKK
jgi:hypothetical protein